jgi:geranylgeranyl diphosphate synthase, type II
MVVIQRKMGKLHPFVTMEFDAQYQAWLTAVERALPASIPPADTPPPELHAAMHHTLQAGGKRLRPVLVLASAALFEPRADPLPAALAVELLHTYTLIHDDLPCMDDAPLRRGRPTAHIAFGEATALLAGDALLTAAFDLLASRYANHPSIAIRLVACLADAAGSRRLIGGQTLDTLRGGTALDAASLDFIHLNKTAALITACLEMGCWLSAAPDGALPVMRAIGRDLGLAFQVVDDILDATSTAATLGKAAGTDARNATNTYVAIHGLEASRQHVAALTRAALAHCQTLDADTRFLQNLILSLQNRVR